MDRVKLNVSGTSFEFDRKILSAGMCPKLTDMCNDSSRPTAAVELTVDRSPISFSSILEYCQTGELHIPQGICPGAFRRELNFWEVDFDALQDCCLYRYHSFLDNEETRRQFLNRALPNTAAVAATVPMSDAGIVRSETKVWAIIDNNEASLPAKVYFFFVSAMVVLSICALAYSTEPGMRRSVSKCELLDYMENVQHKHIEMVKAILGHPDCEKTDSLFPTNNWSEDMFDIDDYKWLYNKYSWGWELPPPEGQLNDASLYSPQYMDFDPEAPEEIKIDIPFLTLPKPVFGILDMVVNAFFTIDLILRMASCPSLRRYFMSLINILDTLALFATFAFIIIVSVNREYQYEKTSWLILLEFAQVFRALRLLRVVKNVRASRVLGYSLGQNLRDLSLLAILLFLSISTFASLFYFAESHDTVTSIPNAWYWAVITMTTVGYGDISPQTGLGRVISAMCAISGVLLLAIMLPMFVNNFLTLYQYSCVNDSIERTKAAKIEEKVAEDSGSRNKVIPIFISSEEPPSYKSTGKPSETAW